MEEVLCVCYGHSKLVYSHRALIHLFLVSEWVNTNSHFNSIVRASLKQAPHHAPYLTLTTPSLTLTTPPLSP